MNVISRPAIDAAIERHSECEAWLNAWWQRAKKENWTSLRDVRRVYPQTDQVGSCLMFNVGAHYRLIVGVRYADDTRGGTLFVKHFLTHAQYDQEQWKRDCHHDD